MRRFLNDRQSILSRGLTLVEIMVVTAISAILLSVLVRFMVVGYPISKTSYLQARSTESARLQLKRVTKALREAKESDTGSYTLVETEPQRIIFYSDVDSDDATERVRLELNGVELVRGIIEPSGDPLEYDLGSEEVNVVVSSVRNGADAIFTYYNGDYPVDQTPLTPADLTEVKYIQFRLLIDADPDIDPPAIEVRSQVQLRNLKTNLDEIVEE